MPLILLALRDDRFQANKQRLALVGGSTKKRCKYIYQRNKIVLANFWKSAEAFILCLGKLKATEKKIVFWPTC